ncbi:Long-chain-fatty-acid--CoA ligase FadD13 [Halioglobus japonicus]|nr:Long-chain-fatty-acid--CoA ligase FadD13 [Halioglobus japonicus]
MTKQAASSDKVFVPFEVDMALPSLLESLRVQQPDKVALLEDGRARTWGESISRIYRMANGLVALGVQPGDRVALLSRNSMAYSEMFAAILVAGACAVPLQSMISEQSLDLMLRDSNAKVFVVSRDMAALTAQFLTDHEQILAGGLLGFDFEDEQFSALESWLATHADSAPGIALSGDAEFNVIYSSGTTGIPKGIVHSHRTRQALGTGLMNLGITADTVTLVATPLYSNTTITTWWPTLCAGGTMVIMPKFDAAGALQLIQQHRVSAVMLVPVQYDRIMGLDSFGDYDLSSLQVKFSTSAPLRAALKSDVIDNFPGELVEFYGLTEGGVGTLFIGSIARQQSKLGSVGPALPGAVLKIIDEQGRALPVGEIGEIVGRSGSMSDGYLNREEANTEMHWYDTDGLLYYRSGDVGYLDEDGWLYLSDRRKDMIISGGFNVYATDLELVLLEHPEIHEVAVVALPSNAWGETPLAIVVREPGATSDETTLKEWANGKLGKLQRISQLVFADDLPKSSIGKVLKRELRQAYAYLGDAER